VRCIAVLYSKPFENSIAPHTTEYRYNDVMVILSERKNLINLSIENQSFVCQNDR